MSLADEIRNEIENIKELKITVGDINNHLSILEGLTRKDIEEREKETYQRGINDGSLDVKQRVEGAYQRGLEDGKWKAEDGCDGCKYYEDTSLTNPCSECSRGHVDHYKSASDTDPIKVGDKVIVPSDFHVEPGKLLSIVNGVCYIMWEDKTVSAYIIDGVRCVK